MARFDSASSYGALLKEHVAPWRQWLDKRNELDAVLSDPNATYLPHLPFRALKLLSDLIVIGSEEYGCNLLHKHWARDVAPENSAAVFYLKLAYNSLALATNAAKTAMWRTISAEQAKGRDGGVEGSLAFLATMDEVLHKSEMAVAAGSIDQFDALLKEEALRSRGRWHITQTKAYPDFVKAIVPAYSSTDPNEPEEWRTEYYARLLGDMPDAVKQALETMPPGESTKDFHNRVIRAMKRLCGDTIEYRKRGVSLEASVASGNEPSSDEHHQAERRFDFEFAFEVCQKLSKEDQETLWIHALGLSRAESAARAGVSEVTFKKRLERATKRRDIIRNDLLNNF